MQDNSADCEKFRGGGTHAHTVLHKYPFIACLTGNMIGFVIARRHARPPALLSRFRGEAAAGAEDGDGGLAREGGREGA